jgi:hypothetical protein
MQHRDAGKLRILQHQIMHVGSATSPMTNDEYRWGGEPVTPNGQTESDAFEDTDRDCGHDKHGDPHRAGPLRCIDLAAVSPKQSQPVSQRRKIQNMWQLH